jgi:phosphate butyryltransferase
MANDPEVIRCISRATTLGLARFILIGPHRKIMGVAADHGVPLGDADFIDETDDVAACARAASLVREGRAQVLMKGLVHTATFSRAFLNKDLDLVPPDSLVSHVALFDIKGYHKLVIITDAALNIDPDVPRKVGIIKNAITFAHRIGIPRPKVALISAVEKVNPKIRSTTDAKEIVDLADKGEFGEAIVDGPFGFDIAVSAEAAKVKGMNNEVAGDADILLFPNIVSANVCYKTLTQFASSNVAGTIMGARCPVVITSRSDTEEVKLHSLGLSLKSIYRQADHE